MSLPANQLPVGEGLGTDGTPGAMFYLDRSVVDTLRDDGPIWKYEDTQFIEEAIQEPDAIYRGLRRAGIVEGFCYSVRPTRDPEAPDEFAQALIPPRFGLVFLVFAVPCVGGMLIFDWEWRSEDPEMPGQPLGFSEDFEEVSWQPT